MYSATILSSSGVLKTPSPTIRTLPFLSFSTGEMALCKGSPCKSAMWSRRPAVPRLLLLLLLFSSCTVLPLTADGSSLDREPELYTEELFLQPLADGSFLAHFHFVNRAVRRKHHNLFPRAISLLAASQPVKEFELSFTHGQWHTEHWGTPRLPTRPIGAELWAVFFDNGCESCPSGDESLAPMWTSLTHSLSGLFCASLNFLDNPLSAAGTLSLSIPGACRPNGTEGGHVLYGALPREAVCTENLTPWLKLLPCRDADGLGALLHRPQVYRAAYHSMHTHLQVHPASTGSRHPSLTLTQSLTLVLRPPSDRKWVTDPHNAEPCQLLHSLWDLRPSGPCPLASTSNVYLGIPSPRSATGLSEVKMFRFGDRTCLWAKAEELLQDNWTPSQPPQLTSQLHVARQDGQGGSLVIHVQLDDDASMGTHRRSDPSTSSPPSNTICVSQLIPWYLRVHLHTLQLTLNRHAANWRSVASKHRVVPSKDREHPTVIEICVPVTELTSQLSLSVRFDKAFLTVFEHPPDTARGFDVPAAMAHLRSGPQEVVGCPHQMSSETPLLEIMEKTSWRQVYTEGLLLPLPYPDFSMPYNVTCFTSTLLAIYLGSILALLLHRPRAAADAAAASHSQSKVRKAAKAVGLLLVFGGLILYLDKDVQRTAGEVLGIDLEQLLSE